MTHASARRLTPEGSGGVAVLLVSGEAAVEELRRRFSRRLPEAGGIALGTLTADSEAADAAAEILDEVVVIARPGEDGYEVHAHGSPFVTAELERLLGGQTPPAKTGGSLPFAERARRAVHAAPTGLGARILLDQAGGAMERSLASLMALDPGTRALALAEIASVGRARLRLFRPATVVLRGPVNAGKSTLFNLLVGADAAAISAIEGTTRDALVEDVRIGPWPVRLIDTAGDRDLLERVAAGDQRAEVEALGQRLADDLAARADLVLQLRPVGCPDRSEPGLGARTAVIGTQAAPALGGAPEAWGPAMLSAREAPAHARGVVLAVLGEELGLPQAVDELWSPGLAVPFDERSILALEEAAALEVTDTVLDGLAQNL